jgi:outer membrane protein OmpA-like peptidoglycan-associated protein
MSMLALTVAVAPACATKKFVRTEVGNVNAKVDTLSTSLEETQERTRKNEERIGVVDQKADAAGKSAQTAQGAADAAAASARQAGTRVDQVGTRVEQVNTQVVQVSTELAAVRKLVFEVTLSEDQGNFKIGTADLPDQARARLDQVIDGLKADSKNVFIEIEGHTDSLGSKELNTQLGLGRAESVKRYLYEQHQIPLHKMNVISFGEDKPVAPNTSREGRAQNRRVVLKVLS